MSRLRVYLLLNSLPVSPPCYAAILSELRRLTRFQLTVINNGQPYAPKRLFHQLGLTCQLISFPLRFHPAQVMHEVLQLPPKEETVLWLEDRLLWNPSPLFDWMKALGDWAWISPNLLPADAKAFTLKIFQEQACAPAPPERRLQLAGNDYFPPCLLFRQEAIEVLLNWARPQGQLPLQLAACDTHSPAWHPSPAPDPSGLDFALTLPEALERWDKTLQKGVSLLRQRVLLESLQKALPDSPQIYTRLLPLLPLEEAMALLKQCLERHLDYPEILALLTQALKASNQEEAAQLCQTQLQVRFPAFKMLQSPWSPLAQPEESLRLPPSLWPQRSTLSVCLIVRDEAQFLPRCLDSVRGLASELIVVDTGSEDETPSLARRYGAQVFYHPWQGDFAAARNQALQHASGHWILILDADEALDEAGRRVLEALLWQPPPGLPRFQLRILNYDDQGEVELVHFMPRLFPRHPMFAYQGRIHEQLVYSGPASSPLQLLPGLEIHHWGYAQAALRQKNKQARNLEILHSLLAAEPDKPEWAYYIADCYFSLQEPQQALSWYDQAIGLWTQAELSESDGVPLALRAKIQSLSCLKKLGRPAEALELALAWQRSCQHNPDYWYLRGQLHRQAQDYTAALAAFETCLSFASHREEIQAAYSPAHVECLPLIQIIQLYRGLMNHPHYPLRERQQAVQKLLRHLNQALQLYPDGSWEVDEVNLYLVLAEAALMGARLQLSASALQLFRQYLPEAASLHNLAYYAETALLLLARQTDSLLDRLPPELGYEQVRELRQTQALHVFCETLWPRSEIEGDVLAMALLHVVAVGQQEPSLFLLLARLLVESGRLPAALRILRDARLYFAKHLSLLHYYATLLLQAEQSEQARQLMQAALELQPDFAPAQQLLARLSEV